MRKMKTYDPITLLPVINSRSVLIVSENRKRIGLIINNYGNQIAYIYDSEKTILANSGFPIMAGFGLAMMNKDTCPQSALYAGQAALGASLSIIEITDEDVGHPL